MRYIVVLLSLIIMTGKVRAESSPFRFHILAEPTNLSVYLQKNSSSLYFLSQINDTLLTYRDGKLQNRLAEKCTYLNIQKLECALKKDLKWSDGSELTAEDFVRSYQNFLDPKNRSYRVDLLLPLKNAQNILDGKKELKELGIKAIKNKIIFELEEPDSEFIYNLISPLLSPQKAAPVEIDQATNHISSGPYKIKSWAKGQKIILENNPYYFNPIKRPVVEIIFISEDSVSLNLYEKNELSFLRRLPTLYIEKFKTRKDYYEVDQWRLDYLGFGPALKDRPHLREALSLSLNYPEMQKLYSAKSPPGCPGIPESEYKKRPCLEFNLEKAKEALQKDKEKNKNLPPLDLYFSKQGGEDHKRAAEWIQAQWRKNLGLNFNLQALENKIFVQKLESQVPTVFRKGINPNRPTCLAALETFTENSRENYLKITDSGFITLIQKMKSSLKTEDKQQFCQKASEYLLSTFQIIPTGPIYFSLLAKPEFTGWHLNELNQLDLAHLTPVVPK